MVPMTKAGPTGMGMKEPRGKETVQAVRGVVEYWAKQSGGTQSRRMMCLPKIVKLTIACILLGLQVESHSQVVHPWRETEAGPKSA